MSTPTPRAFVLMGTVALVFLAAGLPLAIKVKEVREAAARTQST